MERNWTFLRDPSYWILATLRWLVEKVRVLIAYESRLARELVRAVVSGHGDFEVVGEVQDEPEVVSVIERSRADFLIIEQQNSGKRPAICDAVFRMSPHVKILAIASGCEESTLYWVSQEIRSTRIETSEDGLLGALRRRIEYPTGTLWR